MKSVAAKNVGVKTEILARWQGEDYPGAQPRFQLSLFGKDLGVYVGLPVLAIFLFKSCENALSTDKGRPRVERPNQQSNLNSESRSQVIEFVKLGSRNGGSSISKRSPGTLVKVKLLNVVETYGNAPVHAQIVDQALGGKFFGATLIGGATAETNIDRVNIEFRFVKSRTNDGLAVPIQARALSLDGTLGLVAKKKDGFFARAALNSTSGASNSNDQGNSESKGLNQIIAKALTSGLLQEFGSESQVARNRAQVLSLQPLTEFYVELTDFFPGNK